MRQHLNAVVKKAVLVLDFSAVTMIDETGALALRDLVQHLQREGTSVYIGGIQRGPLRMLLRMGVVASLERSRFCKHLETAVRRASKELLSEAKDRYLSPVVLKPVDGREEGAFAFYTYKENG